MLFMEFDLSIFVVDEDKVIRFISIVLNKIISFVELVGFVRDFFVFGN